MKKIALLLFVFFHLNFLFAQTNFIATDCSGNNHDLFSELNSGKVIVLNWVMPCSFCVGADTTIATAVSGFATSNPGRVQFYLADDFGDTPCSALISWTSTNFLHTNAIFSDSTIRMSDYGPPAMQRTVVLGGSNHLEFFNQEGALNLSDLQLAISNALATDVSEFDASKFQISISPNPLNNYSIINYQLHKNFSSAKIVFYNVLGNNLKQFDLTAKEGLLKLNSFDFNPGIYFYTLNIENILVATNKLIVD